MIKMLPFSNKRKLSPKNLLAMASQKTEVSQTRIVKKCKTFSPSKYITAFSRQHFKVDIFISIILKIGYSICMGFPQNGFIFDQSLNLQHAHFETFHQKNSNLKFKCRK